MAVNAPARIARQKKSEDGAKKIKRKVTRGTESGIEMSGVD